MVSYTETESGKHWISCNDALQSHGTGYIRQYGWPSYTEIESGKHRISCSEALQSHGTGYIRQYGWSRIQKLSQVNIGSAVMMHYNHMVLGNPAVWVALVYRN